MKSKEKVAIAFVEWCALNGWEKYPKIDRWKRTWTVNFCWGPSITKHEYGATGNEVFKMFLSEQEAKECDATKSNQGTKSQAPKED